MFLIVIPYLNVLCLILTYLDWFFKNLFLQFLQLRYVGGKFAHVNFLICKTFFSSCFKDVFPLSVNFSLWCLEITCLCFLLFASCWFFFSVLLVEQFLDNIASCRFISILFGTCGAFETDGFWEIFWDFYQILLAFVIYSITIFWDSDVTLLVYFWFSLTKWSHFRCLLDAFWVISSVLFLS